MTTTAAQLAGPGRTGRVRRRFLVLQQGTQWTGIDVTVEVGDGEVEW